MQRRKLWTFRLIAAGLPILAVISSVGGCAAYRELSLSYEYCGPYGAFDDELGWKLRANASSCLALKNRLTGRVYFDSRIHTNRLGLRDSGAGHEVASGGILSIGDSWTFGYGVNHEQSYPKYLADLSRQPVANAGVPAYGAGSVLLLLRRQLPLIRPRTVVYFTKGLWTRSICQGEEIAVTLVPCFAPVEGGGIMLVTPSPGAVTRAVTRQEYPGGSWTSGYQQPFHRRLLRRSLTVVETAARRWLMSPVEAQKAVDVELARRVVDYELERHVELSRMFNYSLLLVDPLGAYEQAVVRLRGAGATLAYVGKAEWKAKVESRFDQLPAEHVYIPNDWHHTPEANAIIAAAVHASLRDAGLSQ